MSESEHDTIMAAIQLVQQANLQSHKDVIELIEKGLQGVNARIDANSFVSSRDIQALTARLDKMNGNVMALQKESNKRDEVIRDFRDTKKKLCTIKKYWWLWVILGFLFVLLVLNVVELGSQENMFKWLIDLLV